MFIREARDYTKVSGSQKSFSASTYIYDVAVDDKGDVYVAVYSNSTIEVFDQNGKWIRTIGTSGKENGQFSCPSAIAIRGSMLYVADNGSNNVQKLTTSGKFISKFGTQGSGKGELNGPRGICLGKDGRVYISESNNNRVSVFEADGKFLHHIIGTTDESKLSGPWGVAFDRCGKLHVADSNTSTIKVFTPHCQYVTQYKSGISWPAGIAIDEEGNTFVAEYYYQQGYYSQLCILNPEHKVINSFRAVQHGTGITVDKEGSIYYCGHSNYCVYKF